MKSIHSIFDKNSNIDETLQFIATVKNKNTIIDLSFDETDIVQTLLSLNIEDYSETLLDNRDSDPPKLYVFGKTIQNMEVYIKFKIKETQNKMIICVSFHYSEHTMNYPYRNGKGRSI
ncbi:MAG: type II toxin-antitoxin system MqsR family toxin [Dialister sp.]|nr:type II toxin-antitoxin system MqsR family toxin [Dialister sp.]